MKQPRTGFLRLRSTNRDQEVLYVTLNAADIAGVKPRPDGTGGSIIERVSQPDFHVWVLETEEQVFEMLKTVGCEVIAIKQ